MGADSQRGGELVIKTQSPLPEQVDCPTGAKSMAGGRGRYSLDLSHDEAAPPTLQKQLSEAWTSHAKEG